MSLQPIQRDSFTLKSNTANLDTPVAEYKVPRGYAALFTSKVNFGLLLPTVVNDVVDAGEAGANSITVSTPGITHPYPLAKNAVDKNVEVYLNGEKQAAANITVDEDAETVTLATTLNENDKVDVFYHFKPGQVSIRRISPQEVEPVFDILFERDLRTVQEQNQVSSKVNLKLVKEAWLPEMFKLAVYLNSSTQVVWTIASGGGAGTDIETGLGKLLFWANVITMAQAKKIMKGYDPAKLVVAQMIGGKQ